MPCAIDDCSAACMHLFFFPLVALLTKQLAEAALYYNPCSAEPCLHLEPVAASCNPCSCDVSKELDDDLRYRTELRTAIQDCFKSSLLPPETFAVHDDDDGGGGGGGGAHV
eukprot:363869-Chlamydomonas_euryale.AAC.9